LPLPQEIPSTEEMWCTVKHYLSAEHHAEETAAKKAREAAEGKIHPVEALKAMAEADYARDVRQGFVQRNASSLFKLFQNEAKACLTCREDITPLKKLLPAPSIDKTLNNPINANTSIKGRRMPKLLVTLVGEAVGQAVPITVEVLADPLTPVGWQNVKFSRIVGYGGGVALALAGYYGSKLKLGADAQDFCLVAGSSMFLAKLIKDLKDYLAPHHSPTPVVYAQPVPIVEYQGLY